MSQDLKKIAHERMRALGIDREYILKNGGPCICWICPHGFVPVYQLNCKWGCAAKSHDLLMLYRPLIDDVVTMSGSTLSDMSFDGEFQRYEFTDPIDM